jgi:hypothetical protein
MISDEILQAITKHAMGDAEEFIELRERFDGCGSFQPHAAAALGYLIAKDELEAAKEEEEEEPDVYDEVVEVIKNNFYPLCGISPHTAADEIFTLIYKWLDDELAKPGFVAFPGHTRDRIDELFSLFVIKKSKA